MLTVAFSSSLFTKEGTFKKYLIEVTLEVLGYIHFTTLYIGLTLLIRPCALEK